jgi:uncharacterized protein YutE (UPF0331/DUF86 family)
MVDPERLRRLLTLASDRLARLRTYAGEDPARLLEDAERLAALDYFFQTAIEACIDAAHHVCASEGWGPPKDNAHAMAVLHDHHVLDLALSQLMAEAVRFRNVLVHLYADVDHRRVLENLQHIDDLARYIAALSDLIRIDPA